MTESAQKSMEHYTDARQVAPEAADELLLELRFKARADRLKLIRGAVRTAARMCGFPDVVAQNLVLAVDEACQNVILHAYRGRGDGELVLALLRGRRGGLIVRLRDRAPPVAPERIRPRPRREPKPGGLGSHFIHQIMDSVTLRQPSDGAGNLLEMIKHNDGKDEDPT